MSVAARFVEVDSRSFEQRFGKACPFCGKNWSDPGRCGPRQEGDWTIQQSLSLIFASRTGRCEICDRHILATHKFCSECSRSREEARRKADRHLQETATCAGCARTFEKRSDKKGQRFCSSACAHRRQYCKRGHDTNIFGRSSRNECHQCRRERQRAKG